VRFGLQESGLFFLGLHEFGFKGIDEQVNAIARKSHDSEMMKRWSLDGANLHAKQAATNEKSRAAQGIALPKKPSAGGITELESGS